MSNQLSKVSLSGSTRKDKGKGKGEPPISSLLEGKEFKSVLGSRSIKSLGVRLMAHMLQLKDDDGRDLALPFLYLPDPDINKKYYRTILEPLCLKDIIDGLAVDETSEDFYFDEFMEVRDKIVEVCVKAQRWYGVVTRTHSDANKVKVACRSRFEILANYIHDDDPSQNNDSPSRILARPTVPKRHFEELDPPSAPPFNAGGRSSLPSEKPSSSEESSKKKKSTHRAEEGSSSAPSKHAGPAHTAHPEGSVLEQAKEINLLMKQLTKSERDHERTKVSLEASKKKAWDLELQYEKDAESLNKLQAENSDLDARLTSTKTELTDTQIDAAHQHELNGIVVGERDRACLERDEARRSFTDAEERIRTLEAQLAFSEQTNEGLVEEVRVSLLSLVFPNSIRRTITDVISSQRLLS
ncbi:hypothetical protein BDY24DRAFT_234698 [Mrakia frigida]|uniref:uncharacterized protein n=1 Tax=Mrakia frigida TaxID=29902 RepID=UPI003FCC2291